MYGFQSVFAIAQLVGTSAVCLQVEGWIPSGKTAFVYNRQHMLAMAQLVTILAA